MKSVFLEKAFVWANKGFDKKADFFNGKVSVHISFI